MSRRFSLILALVAFVSVSASARIAVARADRNVSVSPGAPSRWEGAVATGSNVQFESASGEPCGQTLADYCDTTLLNVDVEKTFWETRGGGLQVRLFNYRPNPASDFDLYIYESDAGGKQGELVASAADAPGVEESTTIPEASGYYLVKVVYFAVTQSQYTAEASFVLRDKFPPDVDVPAGLQEHLASDPAKGFRSHSEPHIAQSPLDPNVLVAGSKMYNLDPDSLKEYEFKIGTYASFDGGVTWSDLGQLAVCPLRDAPPESWPNNDCYPEEDPDAAGTGPEDVDDPDDPNDPFDAREKKGDIAEEYITSDPWIQFDDEGNAYAMVLDSPPFDGEGLSNGWGMTLHKWESVSPADLQAGRTWSKRIPINAYPDSPVQELFLDDKNTFAVNNAGPDGDGNTGPMVACWGQNIEPLIKQQIVCERSTNGGWPDEPVPISPPSQQLVIGVHVVADTRDPNTFYATWLHYVPGIVGAPDEMWVAKSVDGGRTWGPPVLAAQLTGIPRSFPGQGFRNLSLPMTAVGPGGEIYLAYADYREASAEDEDQLQADIVLVKSTDGGGTWSAPVKVNQDDGDADQFQPSVAVTPAGQVNVVYFDRRHDVRVPGAHPGNFFIDTYLSRSNDGGATFRDVRLSHDMWDPTINPPISSSGQFIGDYQGLVADNCHAIPFVNDTHLANSASRDPEFDSGLTRSKFQEVFAWRVPNTSQFAGDERACVGETGSGTGEDSTSGPLQKSTGASKRVAEAFDAQAERAGSLPSRASRVNPSGGTRHAKKVVGEGT